MNLKCVAGSNEEEWNQKGGQRVPRGKEIHSHGVNLSCPIHFTKPRSIYCGDVKNKSQTSLASTSASDTAQLLSIYFNWALNSNLYMECISWFHFPLSQPVATIWKEGGTYDTTHKGTMRVTQAPSTGTISMVKMLSWEWYFTLPPRQDAWSWVWAEAIQRSRRDKSFLRAWSVKREACQPVREPELSEQVPKVSLK